MGQYFGTSQNGIEDKQSETEGVICNTIQRVKRKVEINKMNNFKTTLFTKTISVNYD